MSDLIEKIQNSKEIFVKQRHELAEFIGYETRNKYEILDANHNSIGFAAEQNKGIFNFLVRQFLGHWRKFDILFFDNHRQKVMQAHHPFRWIFQRLEMRDHTGRPIGALQQRFSILHKKFDVVGDHGQHLFYMISPLWRIWTFKFMRRENEVARVEKKWSGLFSEALTDRDNFRILMNAQGIEPDQRMLLVASAVFIDLMYFEKKAGRNN